jgi:hypothetical protein
LYKFSSFHPYRESQKKKKENIEEKRDFLGNLITISFIKKCDMFVDEISWFCL